MTVTVDARGAAARLRSETAEIHRLTETEPFVVELLDGRRDAGAYLAFAEQLRPVYAALEGAVRAARADVPTTVAALFDPRLERVAALDADLAHLRGLVHDGAGAADATGTLLPATAAYAARIEAASGSWPRLLAHHYVRYLGDLSGGQIVAAMLRRHYGLPDEALSFYAFDDLGSKGRYKHDYRAGLDEALTDPADLAAAVDEAREAYARNRAIFAALA